MFIRPTAKSCLSAFFVSIENVEMLEYFSVFINKHLQWCNYAYIVC